MMKGDSLQVLKTLKITKEYYKQLYFNKLDKDKQNNSLRDTS